MSASAYSFGDFELLAQRRVLLRNGEHVPLGGRATDLLLALVERAGELVPKEELIARTWPGMVVEDANLRVHISALRRTLGDSDPAIPLITNVPGRGYSLSAEAGVRTIAVAASEPGETSEPPRTLPYQLSSLIGREEDVAHLGQRVRERRLLSVCGPVGVGKSAVATAVARALEDWPERLLYLDLAQAADTQEVALMLASAAQSRVELEYVIDSLRAQLCGKPGLLILDNIDHLLLPMASLVERLLRTLPSLHILTTSREPLEIEGEWVQRLQPLAESRDPRKAAEGTLPPAVSLFIERAAAALGGFAPDALQLRLIVALCAQLGGLPLAIELAAGQLETLELAGLLAIATQTPWALGRGRRHALPRHRSVGAMLEWSLAFLTDQELTFLEALTELDEDFSFASVTAMHGEMALFTDAVTLLHGLIAKSVVIAATAGGRTLFKLLPPMRRFIRARVEAHARQATNRLTIAAR